MRHSSGKNYGSRLEDQDSSSTSDGKKRAKEKLIVIPEERSSETSPEHSDSELSGKRAMLSASKTNSGKMTKPTLPLTSSTTPYVSQHKAKKRRSAPAHSPRTNKEPTYNDKPTRATSSASSAIQARRKLSNPIKLTSSDIELVKSKTELKQPTNDDIRASKTNTEIFDKNIFTGVSAHAPESKISLWEKIFKPSDYSGKFLIPMGSKEMKEFLERKITNTAFNSKYRIFVENFDKNKCKLPTNVRGHSINQVLHSFPELIKKLNTVDGHIIKNEGELLLIKQINQATDEFGALRDALLGSLSDNNQSSEERRLYIASILLKSVKYFSPENSHYVLNLIGNVKYKYAISQGIYFVANAATFLITQYREEVAADISRLATTYQEVERVLRRFITEGVLESPDFTEYRHSSDIQSISFICMSVWKRTLEDLYPGEPLDKAFKKIHGVKVIELSLNMFIALSRYFLEQRSENKEFNFYDTIPNKNNQKLNESIILEFSQLMKNNLSSKSNSTLGSFYAFFGVKSMESRGFQSVTAATFRHMIDFCNRVDEPIDEEEQKLSTSGSIENERLKQLYRDVIEKSLSNHLFILHQSFSQISYIDENSKPKRFKSIPLSGDRLEEEKAKAVELSNIMTRASKAIASGAGLKTIGLEIKLATFFRYIATSGIAYFLNSVILKKVCSDKTMMLMYLPAYKLIDSQVKKLIDMYDRKVQKEQEKYNENYRLFHANILKLFDSNYINVKLNSAGASAEIESITVHDRFKLYSRIMSESIDSSLNCCGCGVDDIAEQDFAAISMATFNLLSIFMDKEAKRIYKFNISKEMISQLSDALGSGISDYLEKNEKTGKYVLRDTPQALFDSLLKIVKHDMERIVEKFPDKSLTKFKALANVVISINRSRGASPEPRKIPSHAEKIKSSFSDSHKSSVSTSYSTTDSSSSSSDERGIC
ncbi:MAG: hypothetical protein ACK5WS_05820 [Alphaproteobacteria bacterium]|jgi:hypothetical protein